MYSELNIFLGCFSRPRGSTERSSGMKKLCYGNETEQFSGLISPSG